MGAPATEDHWAQARAEVEIKRLAASLLPRVGEIAVTVLDGVIEQVPELVAPDDERGMAAAMASTVENIGAMLSTLAFAISPTAVEAPEGARELLRHMVEQGGDVTTLMNGYRAGHVGVWRHWTDHVAASLPPDEVQHIVLRETSAHFFGYIDNACRQLERLYRRELAPEPSPAPGHLLRQELIASLLGGDSVDVESARRLLGYELGGHHVALVLSPLSSSADLRAALDAIAGRAGCPQVLSRAREDGCWSAWLGWQTPPDAYVYAAIAQTPLLDVVAGLGEPGHGIDGFRRSHEQAADVDHLIRMARLPRPGVTAHEEVALAALLCRDRVRAERFAVEQLSGLAAREDAVERLRRTVATYLACGLSKVHAADALHVHKKTVTYRLARAEELLGRRVDVRSAELDAALRIHQALFSSQG
ncbi:MAG: PucR family transcriptional regulator [Solirubrobacteraceae bacterium]